MTCSSIGRQAHIHVTDRDANKKLSNFQRKGPVSASTPSHCYLSVRVCFERILTECMEGETRESNKVKESQETESQYINASECGSHTALPTVAARPGAIKDFGPAALSRELRPPAPTSAEGTLKLHHHSS